MEQRDKNGRFLPGNTISCKGAEVTNSKYRHLLSAWGKKGYQATINKYFNGDREAANEWLSKKGLHAQDNLSGYTSFLFTFEDPGEHPARSQDHDQQSF